MKSILKYFLMLTLILPASCIRDEFLDEDCPCNAGEEKEMTLKFALPYSAPNLATRAIGDKEENMIETFDVLAFKVDEQTGKETFIYSVPGRNIDPTQTGSIRNFRVKLRMTDFGQRFVFIANSRDRIETLINEHALGYVGEEKETMLSRLIIELTDGNNRWNTTGAASYARIPMWGESKVVKSISAIGDISESNIPLLRMIAKVDVQINEQIKNVFKLTGVHIYNANLSGRIVPKAGRVENFKAKAPSLPAGVKSAKNPVMYGPTDFSTAGIAMKGVIYLLETAAQTDPAKQTCIVVSGKYNGGAETFYRLDFLGANGKYLDILRNHIYTFNIVQVKGNGYASAEEACAAKPFNMESEILVWDDGEIRDIVFNGQYMLGVNQSKFVLSAKMVSGGNILKITTDYPGGWTAEVCTDEAGKIPMTNGWLTLSNNSGAGGAQPDDVTLTAEVNSSSERTAYIRINAGILHHTVTVTQMDAVSIPPIDYLMLHFEWESINGDGDVAVRFAGNGAPFDGKPVGYGMNSGQTLPQPVYHNNMELLKWGGDYMSSSINKTPPMETVYMNAPVVFADNKLPQFLTLEVYANWYANYVQEGPMTLRMSGYVGGVIEHVGTGFFNKGGEMVYESKSTRIITTSGTTNAVSFRSGNTGAYTKVCTIQFDRITQEAKINWIAAPTQP